MGCMMESSVSQADRDNMVELYNQGNTYAIIVEATGYSTPTCRKYIRAAGIKPRSRTVPMDDREKMVELYNEKCSVVEISKQTGYQVATCRKYLREAGITIRHTHPSKCPDDIAAKIVEAYEGGATAKEAAGMYGYAETTAFSVLKRAGVETRAPRTMPPIPDEDRTKMVELYEDGKTYQQIGEITGYSTMSCWKYVRDAGAKSRFRYEFNETAFDDIDDEASAY